ncbi:MAG: fatty acid desaturase [Rhodovibrionaceae bacterium]|nr:fatty acid desaturase [Rhodovibrionaceae bacterium]
MPAAMARPHGAEIAKDVSKPRRPSTVEWPTVLLLLAVYGLFGLVTWLHAALPIVAVVLAGGLLTALHGSLQHEAIHGHPTPWAWVHRLLIFPSLWLWVPFETYRSSHLAHHRDERLTDPVDDPESFYMDPTVWRRMSRPARLFFTAHNTLLGRLLLGPWLCVYRVIAAAVPRLARGERDALVAWTLHGLSVALVLGWVIGLCGMPLWLYLLAFVYPGIALTLLRSFAEHRAHPKVGRRTAIVEAGALFSLLFLNNNLHVVHHAEPGVPWYRLPARYRAGRRRYLRQNGGYLFADGYLEIVWRYLLSAKEPPAHPCLPSLTPAGLPKTGQLPTARTAGGQAEQPVPLAPER